MSATVVVLAVAGVLARQLAAGDAHVAQVARSSHTAHRLTGDLDGDGVLDSVSLGRGGHLRVHLGGTTTTLTRSDPDLTRLVGLAAIGSAGSAIVGSQRVPSYARFGVRAREAVVIRIVGGRLRAVGLAGGSPIARDPFGTFWIRKGHLDAASYIAAGTGRRSVSAWTFALAGNHLRAIRLGRMCWDRRVEAHPTACQPGHDDAARHGPLPDLLPAVGPPITAGHSFTDTVGGRRVTVRYISGVGRPMETMARVHLSMTVAGRTIDDTTPRLAPAGVTPRLIDGADGGIGVVFRAETGDGEEEAVYELRRGRIRAVRVARAIPFGDVFYLGFESFRTWQGPDGSLYSALPVVEATSPDREVARVWAWRLADDRLTARPVGIVCVRSPAGRPGPQPSLRAGSPAAAYHRCRP